MDRISPGLEPDQPVIMHQSWHHLLFLHWEIAPAVLQALIPGGLSVDTFEGKAYVGLVPFTITGLRPVLMPPIPGLSSFHEVNVRTYVHHQGAGPGVWFFSLDASNSLAVAAARATFKLPYFSADIDWNVMAGALPEVEMRCHRRDSRSASPAHIHARYTPAEGPVRVARPGTLEHFLLERYILYAVDEGQRLYRARVHHSPYPVQHAELQQLDETLVWAAGVKRSDETPIRHYAREVNVKVYPLERLP